MNNTPLAMKPTSLYQYYIGTQLGGQICYICAALASVFILGTTFQAFLPLWVGTILIALRLIVLPCVCALLFYSLSEAVIFGWILIGYFICELVLGTEINNETMQVMLSIIMCLPLLKGGMALSSEESARPIWLSILASLIIFNLVTIALYVNALRGGSLAAEAFTRVQREGEDPLFRFALGNAIELPALVTIATVGSVAALTKVKGFVVSALVANLVTAAISQSRFVVLIAGWPIVRMWKRLSLGARLIVIVLASLVVLAGVEDIGLIIESISRRFAGDDANSGKARWEIVTVMKENANLACLAFGNGVNSSFRMMQAAGLGYRSVEAVLLQLVYEFGILRISFLVWFAIYTAKRSGVRLKNRVDFVLVAAQVLFALPVMTFTPLFAFFAALLCTEKSCSRRPGWQME